MEKMLGLGLWVVVALYAAIGVFGVVFHNMLPGHATADRRIWRQLRDNGGFADCDNEVARAFLRFPPRPNHRKSVRPAGTT